VHDKCSYFLVSKNKDPFLNCQKWVVPVRHSSLTSFSNLGRFLTNNAMLWSSLAALKQCLLWPSNTVIEAEAWKSLVHVFDMSRTGFFLLCKSKFGNASFYSTFLTVYLARKDCKRKHYCKFSLHGEASHCRTSLDVIWTLWVELKGPITP